MSYESRIDEILREAEKKLKISQRESADHIRDEAKMRVPVATGRTRKSIKVVRVDTGLAVTVDFPGHLLEFGTVKMGAQPFLTPAAELERPRYIESMKKAYE